MVALKTLIFSILVPGTVAFVIPWLLLQQPWGLVFMFPSIWLVGFLPLLLGVGLYLWCAGAFTFLGTRPVTTPLALHQAKATAVASAQAWAFLVQARAEVSNWFPVAQTTRL
jgi:hypothetical protein